METIKRIQLLSSTEVEELYARPDFNIHEQHLYLTLTPSEREALAQFSKTKTRIFFILQLGYFKAKQQFFNFTLDEVNSDVQFIVNAYYSEAVGMSFTGRISRDYVRVQRQATPLCVRLVVTPLNPHIGLPTLEDKIVQQSVADILQSIWEQDFLKSSYGYRPNKSAQQAVHSLQLNLQYGCYGYVVEAGIKGFFDNMDHAWLMKMLKQRIDVERLLTLINQWLKARVVEPEGVYQKPQPGTPQGGVISPILANIYLHYALDIWFERRIKPKLQGKAMLIRYADDFVVAFQYHNEAMAFYSNLGARLKTFNLEVAPEKTSIKRFSRFHPNQCSAFEFLGFQFYWDTDFKGEQRVRRKTSPKKHKAALVNFYSWIKANRHQRLERFIPELNQKVQGFRNYFALSGNSMSVGKIFDHVLESLYKWLNRRSQRKSYTWQGLKRMLQHFGFRSMRVRKPRVLVDWY